MPEENATEVKAEVTTAPAAEKPETVKPAAKAAVKRKFTFNGMELADPDPKMSPEKVCEFHSLLHTELTNATVKGPTKNAAGEDEYKFTVNVGKFG